MKTEILDASEMGTFIVQGNDDQDLSHNLTTAPIDQNFEVNSELAFKISHKNLPFSDLKIAFTTPSGHIKSIKAHKVIMAQGSEFVAEQIQSEKSDAETVLAITMKVEEADVKSVLDLIYTGKSGSIAKERRTQFMELLSFFKIENFKMEDALGPPMIKFSPPPIPATPHVPSTKKKRQSPSAPGQKDGNAVKVKVQKEDPQNTEPFSKEELAWVMQFNVIPAEDEDGFCIPCGKPFAYMRSAKAHFKTTHTHHGADTSFCQGCGIGLPTSQMIDHFKTQPCGFEFNENLKQSLENASGEANKFIIAIGSGRGKCLICEKEFGYLRSAKAHYKTAHSGEMTIYCVICGKNSKNMAQHYKDDHKVQHKNIMNRFNKFVE